MATTTTKTITHRLTFTSKSPANGQTKFLDLGTFTVTTRKDHA